MHPAFAVIQFGPFKSDYHNAVVDSRFKEALSDFLVTQLLPQVDEPFESTSGRVRAAFDHQKYCGPNSAVRDVYILEFEFRRSLGADAIKITLFYSAKQRSFGLRSGDEPIYLWTASRKAAEIRDRERIKDVCDEILRGELVATAPCPRCGAALNTINTPGLFDVSCPGRCFNYSFHRDEKTGEFLHGHFFCAPRADM